MSTTEYAVTVEFSGPEDCAWFARQCQNHKVKVALGSQLEGAGRAIMMAALGRSTAIACTMGEDRIKRQISGSPA